MKFTPELYYLTLTATVTALMWLPYMLGRIATRGVMSALGYPDASTPSDPAWAERARRAHYNAVENLVVFAPLVLIANLVGVSTTATVLAVKVYLAARLVHYLVYSAGI